MKTRNYNLGKVLLTILFSVSLSVNCNASSKGHETSISSKNNEVIATLAPAASSNTKMVALSETLQGWMENGSYWEEVKSNAISTDKLAEELEDWISKGAFWNNESTTYNTFDNLVDTLKIWLNNSSYWNKEDKE